MKKSSIKISKPLNLPRKNTEPIKPIIKIPNPQKNKIEEKKKI